MDLTEPGLAFSGTLAMPILRALDGRSEPATAAQVARVAGGTQAGVRRALERLALHGICRRQEIADRVVYSLNYHHILYPAVRNALDAPTVLVKHLRKQLSSWDPQPESATLFGSTARRDGDADSDVDVLLVRPSMPKSKREQAWIPQIHDLRDDVFTWSGNRLQLFDWPLVDLRRYMRRERELVDEILRDGIVIAGSSLDDVIDVGSARSS